MSHLKEDIMAMEEQEPTKMTLVGEVHGQALQALSLATVVELVHPD